MKEEPNDQNLQHTETYTHRKKSLDDEEHADFLRHLEIYDMNQSEFIREAISGATIKPTIVATLVSDDLLAAVGKLIAEYGRIGNNLDQIARHLNEWHSPYPAMAKELQSAVADLATLKFEVMKKVGDGDAFFIDFFKGGRIRLLARIRRRSEESFFRFVISLRKA